MARYECPRCNKICFTTEPEHVCKDIRQRLARREKQIRATMGILDSEMPHPNADEDFRRMVAEKIVGVLANLGVDND